jgi:hypothetical protein
MVIALLLLEWKGSFCMSVRKEMYSQRQKCFDLYNEGFWCSDGDGRGRERGRGRIYKIICTHSLSSPLPPQKETRREIEKRSVLAYQRRVHTQRDQKE